MPADKRFCDRIERIQSGKTWAPAGVLHNLPTQGGASARTQGMRAVRRLVVVMAVGMAFAVTQPDYVPEPILAFLTAPDTEAAMASLGQMPGLPGF